MKFNLSGYALFKLLLVACSLASGMSFYGQCCSNGVNLLENYNPTFSDEFTDIPPGFQTDNTYSEFLGAGLYSIIVSRNYGACSLTPQFDHTTGDSEGGLLWFDTGFSATATTPQTAWKPYDPNRPPGQENTIDVVPNTNYVFSVWIRDLARNPDCQTGGAPIMGLRINGVDMAEINLGDYTSPCCPEWVYLCSEWNSGNSTTVLIQIESRTGQGFTDLGIDDVYFGTTDVDFDGLLGNDIATCAEENFVLAPDLIGAEYLWSDGSTNDSLLVTEPGLYWVEIQQGTCTGADSILISIGAIESIDLGEDLVLCENEIVELEPDIFPSGDYLWQNGSTEESVLITEPGLYWLQISSDCGNTSDSINVSFIDPIQPFDLGEDEVICENSALLLQPDIFPQGEYLWQNGSDDESITVAQPGLYWLKITSECESLVDSINVLVHNMYSAPDAVMCQNGSATLQVFTDSDFDNSYTYYWSTNQTGSTIEVSPAQDTQYFVYAQFDTNCYSDTIYIDVDVLDSLALVIANDSTFCPGGTVNAQVFQSTGGDGNYTFTWTVNGNQIGAGAQFLHTPGIEGQYCVTMSDGCETTPVEACMQIWSLESIPLTIWSDVTSGCSPLPVQFELTTPNELYTSVSWNIEDQPSSIYGPEASCIFLEPKKYDVTITLISGVGCLFTKTFSDYIEVYPDPIAAWIANPQPTTLENTVITFNNLSQGSNLVSEWEFDGGANPANSNEFSPVVIYPDDVPGEYEVRLLVTDENGCQNFIEGAVVINDVLNIYIPNSFTPDNDGINDFWRVEGTDISDKDFMLIVFNRWGEEVFRTTDPLEPWTGNCRGGDYIVQNEVYNYVLKVSAQSTREEREINGTVTIIR